MERIAYETPVYPSPNLNNDQFMASLCCFFITRLF